jgi:hypothetical protein
MSCIAGQDSLAALHCLAGRNRQEKAAPVDHEGRPLRVAELRSACYI